MWCDKLTGYVHTQKLSYCALTILSEFLGSQISYAMPSHYQPFQSLGDPRNSTKFHLFHHFCLLSDRSKSTAKSSPICQIQWRRPKRQPASSARPQIAEHVSVNFPQWFDTEVHHVHDYPWHFSGQSLRAARTNDSAGRIKPGKRSRPSEHLRNSLFCREGSSQICGKAIPYVSITAGALASFSFWCVNSVPFHNPP